MFVLFVKFSCFNELLFVFSHIKYAMNLEKIMYVNDNIFSQRTRYGEVQEDHEGSGLLKPIGTNDYDLLPVRILYVHLEFLGNCEL